jgi:hypothetical protein
MERLLGRDLFYSPLVTGAPRLAPMPIVLAMAL